MRKIREWVSIYTVKAPKLVVLLGITAANVFFVCVAALVIMLLAPPSLEPSDFWSCVYYAVTLLVSGYVGVVVDEIGQVGALMVIFSTFTVILGMIAFTGAVVGYMTELISNFIENADSSSRRLRITGHIVILNWNTRAAEIVNELLYKKTREKIVVLMEGDRDEVLSDIGERLSDTIAAENEAVSRACSGMSLIKRRQYTKRNSVKNKLTIIVREGDPWSAKQLGDISIKSAKSVIILSTGSTGAPNDSEREEYLARTEKGNTMIIKTLLQVAQLTAEEDSVDNQLVVVEVEDDRTLALVNTIVGYKTQKNKRKIVPVAVNHILGQIFTQVSIMPELNIVYSVLFSNKGASFFTMAAEEPFKSEEEFVSDYLGSHSKAIPLTVSDPADGKQDLYYLSENSLQIQTVSPVAVRPEFSVALNPDFEIKDRNVIILGHNSKNTAIMEGFDAFNREWKKQDGPDALSITVIDNETYLTRNDYYRQYPFVKEAVAADIFDKERICGTIDNFISWNSSESCVLILSDDTVSGEEIDADVLTYLIMVQDIINSRIADDPDFDPGSVDMVAEILNPKNYEIVRNYSTNNIVISNRYISKIIAQLGEKESLFDFYYDILTFDEPVSDPDSQALASKELYIKKAAEFFRGIPGPCTAAELIRAVYQASGEDNKSVVLGYIKDSGEMILFEGEQSDIRLTLSGEDKLLIYSNH